MSIFKVGDRVRFKGNSCLELKDNRYNINHWRIRSLGTVIEEASNCHNPNAKCFVRIDEIESYHDSMDINNDEHTSTVLDCDLELVNNCFKKGDKVVNKSNGHVDVVLCVPGMSEYDSHHFSEPASGMITEKRGWERQENWNLIETRLKFKVGDRVRKYKRSDRVSEIPVGTIGTIIKIIPIRTGYFLESTYEIKYDGETSESEGCDDWLQFEMEKIDRPGHIMKWSISEGDRVRIVKRKRGNTTGACVPYHGHVGVIGIVKTRSFGGGNSVWDESLNRHYYGIFDDDELELVIEPINVYKTDYKQFSEPKWNYAVPKDFYSKSFRRAYDRDFDVLSGQLLEFYKNNDEPKSSENKIGKIMRDVIEFAKNLILSKEEKLLRKHGLKTDSGQFTSAAKEIVIEKMTKEAEAHLIEIATKMEEECKSSCNE